MISPRISANLVSASAVRPGRHDAQRQLDELEVLEVARAGLGEGLFGLTVLHELQRLVDRGPHDLELVDGVVARHRALGAGRPGRGGEEDAAEQDEGEQPAEACCHAGYFAR